MLIERSNHHRLAYTASAVLALMSATVRPAAAQSPSRAWYVASDGNDGNTGTTTAPFRTITRGVMSLRPGDALIVGAGTYSESFGNGDAVIPGSVTITVSPPKTVTIKPPASRDADKLLLLTNPHIKVTGFILDGSNVTDEVVKVTWGRGGFAHHVEISDCEVRNAPGSGILVIGDPYHPVRYGDR